MTWRPYAITGGAAALTAVAGTVATDVGSRWYRRLDKPPFQPPGPLFGIVWTVVYSLIAVGTGRVLGRLPREQRARFGISLGVNLVLNAGWTWIFFRGRRPALATAEIVALQVSNVDLLRRAARVDRTGAALLVPYAAWVAFATILSADIARRNPR